MKVYKATDKDMKCRGFQYEIGKTAEVEGDIGLCKNGIHACEMPLDVVRCLECKHHYWEQEPCHGKSVHYCKLPHMRGVEVFKEFFCYYGEKRRDKDGTT